MSQARYLAASAAVLAGVVLVSGCSVPITEPDDFPAAIRNQLDESIEVFDFRIETPETTTAIVSIGAGEIHEFPMGALCAGTGLVAETTHGEVGRLDDRCSLFSDSVWVLRDQGNYITDYYGDSTIYRDE